MYNFTILSGTNVSNPYDNPNGITYITTGSAGSSEGHAPINPDSKDKKWFHKSLTSSTLSVCSRTTE